MSDSEQTIVSSPINSSGQSIFKKNPLLTIGSVGCLLLLCALLLIGGGIFFARERIENVLANFQEQEAPATTAPGVIEPAPTVTPTAAKPTDEPTIAPTSEADVTVTNENESSTDDQDNLSTTSQAPEISRLTFALGATPDEYEPIDPGLSFGEGITEVHAIFDYSGMSNDYNWERVWYLDGAEILRNEAEWSGDETGRFDYFIDAAGEPLSPGEWTLELYVEGDLLSTGNFTIEATNEVTETAVIAELDDEEAEHAADLDTPTPQPTPTAIVTPTPTTASLSNRAFQLLYTKWDGGQHNLYVADTNGNNERFLLGRAAGPSWMPDGSSIFFYGAEGVDRQTIENTEYVFDGISNGIVSMIASPLPTSIDQVELFQGLDWKQGTARTANVSPNGEMVAFDAQPGGGAFRIFFLGTENNQQFRFEILGEHADWSPDSERLVYRSGRNGTTGLWISNRDDTGHALITNHGSDSFPAWSPDGKTIAFSRDEGGNVDIYTVDVDGSNLQRLTTAPGPDTLPVYTPDGDIIFRSARSGSWSIWKMTGSGAEQTEIIPNTPVAPDWSFSRMDVR